MALGRRGAWLLDVFELRERMRRRTGESLSNCHPALLLKSAALFHRFVREPEQERSLVCRLRVAKPLQWSLHFRLHMDFINKLNA